jgi:tripartite-type tricarboxylate transporter receptor subunit TctC
MKKLIATMLGIVVACATVNAAAQTYPRKPVQLIVPVAPGGNLDLVARAVSSEAAKGLGQPIIVDNRPSNSSLVGTQLVARATPDGYTLLATHTTTVVVPSIVLNAGYDAVKDFVGVSQTCSLPVILVANPALPVKSVPELIAYIKANPGKLTVSHAGLGTSGHMAWELLNQRFDGKLQVVQVPYKGSAPALIDVIGGQVDVTFDTFSTSIQHVKSGKLRALGLAAGKRSAIFPDLPTVAEAANLPGYDPSIFNGILAPAGTPREALIRLHREIARAVQQPELRNRFMAQGVELVASESPDQFTEFFRQQYERYAKLVRDAGIKPE